MHLGLRAIRIKQHAPIRLRRGDIGLRLAYKKVVLVDNDQPLPTLGFVI